MLFILFKLNNYLKLPGYNMTEKYKRTRTCHAMRWPTQQVVWCWRSVLGVIVKVVDGGHWADVGGGGDDTVWCRGVADGL